MAETVITNQVCDACGSEVRENSMFCFHCGGALEAENVSDDSPSDAWFRGEITEKKDDEVKEKVEEKPAKKKSVTKELKDDLDNKLEETESDEIPEEVEEVEEETSKVNVINSKPFKEKSKKKRRRRKTKLKAIDSDTDKDVEVEEIVAEDKVEEKVAEKELVETKIEEKVEEKVEEKKIIETKADELKTSHPDNSKLKSASSLRKRTKPSRIKKVEIVWEERDSSPNIWFIIGGLILSGVVAGLVFLAFYLK